ncbi:MAG: hypothetical protein EOO27_40345 [Comamonadaceae bacterium]|nr:MAG: hypothetical protein EOO27_40345 [Comamonadaceae bacterium]
MSAVALSAAGAPSPNNASDRQKLEAKELEQRRLHGEVKEKLDSMPASRRKEELQRLLAEIEQRLNEQKPGTVYLSPSSNLTPEMSVYYERLKHKIEDCGTRHLPKRGGMTVYGKGSAAIEVDRKGGVVDVDVLDSTKDKLVDRHFQRVVRASSPFGLLPEALTIDGDRSRQVRSAVLSIQFEFKRANTPIEPLPNAIVANGSSRLQIQGEEALPSTYERLGSECTLLYDRYFRFGPARNSQLQTLTSA